MRVLRVECRGCPKPHGPLQSHQMTYDEEVAKGWTYMQYGGRLETPQSDPLLNFTIAAFEQCGTLPDMFDRWWSTGTRLYELMPEPWIVAVYEASKARVGKNQVLFDRDNSTELLLTPRVQVAIDFAQEGNTMFNDDTKTVYPVVTEVKTRTYEINLADLVNIYDLKENNFTELIVRVAYYDIMGVRRTKKIVVNAEDISY